jgi:hypothetical protein
MEALQRARRARRRRPTPWIGAILLATVALAWARDAAAEPYMAIREGRKCSSCHVNVRGGGMRTLLANTHMKEITHYRDLFPEFEEAAESFNGQITSFFSIGGDLRVDDAIVFQDEPNEEGRVPNDKVFRSRVEENILEVREAAIYGLVDLYPEYLSFYIDVSFAPGGTNVREVFGLLRGLLPWKGYVKAGRFYLDYGLGYETDNLFSLDSPSQNLFVRGRTGTDFNAYDDGVELGLQPGPFHIAASVTNGSSGDDDVRITFTTYAMLTDLPVIDSAILGASFLRIAPDGSERIAYGFFAGANLGRLEYHAEVDFLHDDVDATGDDPAKAVGTFLAYGELNYLLLDWINTKVFGEYADNDGQADMVDTAQNRFGVGIEPFLSRFLQTRLFYSVANGPETLPISNQNWLVMELHLFF